MSTLSCWKLLRDQDTIRLAVRGLTCLPGNRPFGVDKEGHPQCIDPIVANWIQMDYNKLNKSDYEQIPMLHRPYYLTQCLLLLCAIKEKEKKDSCSSQTLLGSMQDSVSLLTPLDVMKKLDLFHTQFAGWYTLEESELLLSRCIDAELSFLACELVYRGIEVRLLTCMRWRELGSLIYGIQESRVLGIDIDRPTIEEEPTVASIPTREDHKVIESPIILDTSLFQEMSQSPLILDAIDLPSIEESPLLLSEENNEDILEELRMFGIDDHYDVF